MRVGMLVVRRSITALIAASAIVACSGGDDEGGTTNPTPTIDIAASAATATVTQGGTASVTVTLTRAGGFTGDVTLAVTGLSAGLTAPNVTIAAGSTTGVVTYAASATATAGTANTTITATGTGVTAKTAAVAVTVNAAPTPAYTMAVAPTTLSITQGANGTATITLTRTGGFAGTVNLTAENLPNGVTAAFNPAAVTANTSTLTLTASATAATGTTNITVRGAATGQTDKTATIALTVNAAAAAGYTLAASAATVTAGATGTSNITITRTGGFADAVTLAVEGLPTGVTGAFNPNNTTTNASVLTLTAAANAAAGTATITVKGTATGQADKTATFQLTVAAAAGYTLAITEPTLTIAAGGTTTANITITRTGGFAGAVALTADNLPTGVTAAFNPASVTANSSVLTLTAAGNAAAASGPITVRGTATGQTDRTATVPLTVTAAAGSYTLALAPSTLTVQQGANGNTAVTITRTGGFTGTVNFTATGLPNGVTATFNPAAATANTSTLTLAASATATTGPATVTVTGTSGAITQTATLALTVSAAVGGSGNTTYEFCTVGNMPLWLAVQDNAPNGTWTRVTPTGTKFQFNVTGPKAAVAFVTGSAAGVSSAAQNYAARMSAQIERELLKRNLRLGRTSAYTARSAIDSYAITVYYGTQTELNSTGTSQCLPGTGKTITGSVAGVTAPFQTSNVSLGPTSASFASGSSNFTLTDVPDGALDLIATRQNINTTTFTVSVDKVILRRAQNFANNAVIPVLDFNAAEAFAPAEPNLTINGLGADVALVSSSYYTAAGSDATGAVLFGGGLPTSGPFKYVAVPAAKQIAGDLHELLAIATPNSQTFDQLRYSALYFKDPVDRAVTLGAALTAPTVSVAATTPYVRIRATGPIQTEYNKAISISYGQSGGSAVRTVNIQASANYLAGLTTYDFTIPDFTGAAGWDNNWGLKAGAQTSWSVGSFGYTGIGFGSTSPLEGATFQGAVRSGQITP